MASTVPKTKLNIKDRFLERSQAERYRDRYKSRRVKTHEREITALTQLLQSIGKIDEIMDVASGPGRFAPLLSAHSTRLIQTDTSRHMLDLSREDYPLDPQRGYYIQSDAAHMPLKDGCVDVLFCHRFLNHVVDPAVRVQIFSELRRVAKRYVIVSCLGLPRLIQMVRYTFARIRFAPISGERVEVPELIHDAEQAGLILTKRTPIRSFPSSAIYLTFSRG